MDRFRQLSTFAAVAEEGPFNAAARRLPMSASAVKRFVSALEAPPPRSARSSTSPPGAAPPA